MHKIEKNLLFTETHEWLKVDNTNGIVGITDYAQTQLGDIVYVDLPEKGKTFKKGDAFGSIESVKSVSDLYAPLDMEIIEKNQDASSNPEIINKDPYGKGWLVKIKILNPDQINSLLKPEDYEKLIS